MITEQTLLISQAKARYEADLRRWVFQTRSARDLTALLRLASQAPSPQHILRPITPLVSSARSAAEREIEGEIERRLDAEIEKVPEIKDLANLARMAAGYWPRIARRLRDEIHRRRSEARP